MRPRLFEFEYQRACFTARLPADYLYSPAHFWLAQRGEGLWRVGLTKFGARMLGEMVDHGFGMEAGAPVAPGQIIGWVEGFKAILDLACLVEGRFAGGNPALETEITLVNLDPHGAGWLYAVKGRPDARCVPLAAYAQVLDREIDGLLARGRAGNEGCQGAGEPGIGSRSGS
jgi:glycine cleavage system H protein